VGGSKTTQTQEAWAPAVPGLKKAIGYTSDWYNDPSQHPVYSGRFTPENDPRRSEAIAGTTDLANNLKSSNFGGAYSDAASHFAQYLAGRTPGVQSFANYDPSGVRSVVDTLVRPMTQKFQQETLPSIYDNLDRSGAAHNSRAAIPLADASEQYGRGISDTATQFAYNDFTHMADQGQQLDEFLLGNLPAMQAAGVSLQDTPNKMLDFAGQQQQSLQGNEIQNALLGNQYARDVPYQDLSRYINAMISLGSTGGTTTTVQQTDPIATALQVAGGLGAAYLSGGTSLLGGLGGGGGGANVPATAANRPAPQLLPGGY
jgi:hypothetical protein